MCRVFLFAIVLFLTTAPCKVLASDFTIGVISSKTKARIRNFVKMASYIASHLENFGVSSGRVIVAEDVDKMIEKLKRGEVDLVFETPFATLKMEEMADVIPSVVAWKKGVKRYRTLFFVKKKSNIKTLFDLRGKLIAFQDPGSTSAYAIPKAELVRYGLEVVPKDERADPSCARYVFVGHRLNQAFWVLEDRADCGAFSENDWRDLPDSIRSRLKIIYKTRPILRYIGSFSNKVPYKLREAVVSILLNMQNTRSGRDALMRAFRIKKIERLTEEDKKELEYIGKLLKII